MVGKIELYREVLEIEPNSKVFFPLARLLAEQGDDDEAVRALTRGITFHPDHLEAKFFLIELLTRLGREGEADAVFADVGSLLSRYPSVWLLWSQKAAARSKDPSLAMLFLANYFQNDSLTWADVMERGLQSLRQEEAADPGPSTVPPAETKSRPEPAATRTPPKATPAAGVDAAGMAESDGPALRGAEEVLALAELLEPATVTAERGKSRPSKNRENVVRTKTMASLLAGQGDIAGARDIYNDLLDTLPPGSEREEIESLMHALDSGESAHPQDVAVEPAAAPEEPVAPGAGKTAGPAKLVNLLEALAGRLDARARA